jgi:hypothetical protein
MYPPFGPLISERTIVTVMYLQSIPPLCHNSRRIIQLCVICCSLSVHYSPTAHVFVYTSTDKNIEGIQLPASLLFTGCAAPSSYSGHSRVATTGMENHRHVDRCVPGPLLLHRLTAFADASEAQFNSELLFEGGVHTGIGYAVHSDCPYRVVACTAHIPQDDHIIEHVFFNKVLYMAVNEANEVA